MNEAAQAALPPRRSLFRKPDFARLWTAATVSLFGSQVTQLAIPFIAAVVLGASPGQVGLLVTVDFLPFLLFTLPAGVWVDRLSRKRILVAADIGRAVMLATIPIAYATGALTIWQLYVVGFVNGIFTVFFDVADQSYLPTVLERDELVDGNSKLQISMSAAQILGQPFGGGIVALLTAPIAIAIDAVSFVASALLIFTIRRPEAPADGSAAAAASEATSAAEPSTAGVSVAAEAAATATTPAGGGTETDALAEPPVKKPGLRAEMTAGLRYIFGNKYLRSIAPTTATSNLFNNIALATFAVFAYRELGLTPELVGLVGGVGGAGVLIGALFATRVAERFGVGPAIVWPILLGGVAGLLVPLAPAGGAAPYLAAAFFFGGLVNVVYNVNQVSLRQAITPQRFLGRMNATMRFLVWGTIPIGSLIGAGLSEVVGVRNTVWIGSLLGLLPFLFVFFSPVRGLHAIPDIDPDTDEDAGSGGAVTAAAA
ncbi:MAG: MFS transporter [Chloroflexota bacterium]